MRIPTFSYEKQYWEQDIVLVAGIDEVGMGALAGPVVAAAVIFDSKIKSLQLKVKNDGAVIRDSKTLSAKQREKANIWIQENALAWAIGEATVEEIEVLNIRKASHLAMRRAIEGLKARPQIALIDGTPATIHPTIPTINIIDGDATCFSIAAASIIAKVHRDAIMTALDKEYPVYGFAGHKGYGAKVHLEALQKHGATPIHRAAYAPVAAILKSF